MQIAKFHGQEEHPSGSVSQTFIALWGAVNTEISEREQGAQWRVQRALHQFGAGFKTIALFGFLSIW
jgi:hypothetical protein